MIDPSMATLTEYPPVEGLEIKVADLTKELEAMISDRNFWQEKANNRLRMIDELEEYLKENHQYMDEDVVERLADIFSLELTRDYDVTVIVKFSGTVTVPLNYNMDDLENALTANLDASYYAGDVEADFGEDSMDIDWDEC